MSNKFDPLQLLAAIEMELGMYEGFAKDTPRRIRHLKQLRREIGGFGDKTEIPAWVQPFHVLENAAPAQLLQKARENLRHSTGMYKMELVKFAQEALNAVLRDLNALIRVEEGSQVSYENLTGALKAATEFQQ